MSVCVTEATIPAGRNIVNVERLSGRETEDLISDEW
jgi:hypothetical protein